MGVICSVLPLVLLYLALRHKNAVVQKDLNSITSWKFLYSDFKSNPSSSLFYTVFLIRRLLYALVLVFLDKYPLAQSLLSAGLAVVVSVT